MKLVFCPACHQTIGIATANAVDDMLREHAPDCWASEADIQQADIDRQFDSIVAGINL